MNKHNNSFGYNQKKYLNSVKNLTKTKINSAKLMKDYGLTIDEIKFLNQLEVFDKYEVIPTRTNGERNGGYVLAHPISTAAFDYYYGAQTTLKNGIQISNNFYVWENTIFDLIETTNKMNIAKPIFNKVSPHLYSKCF